MPILPIYLWRRLALPCLVAFVSLFLLLGVFRLTKTLSLAAVTDIPLFPLLAFWFLKLVAKSAVLLPVGMFLGLLYALSRMAGDGEWVACASVGWGLRERLRAAWRVALPVALLAAFLSLYVAPRAETAADRYLRMARATLNLEGLRAGEFHALGHGVLYLERVGEEGDLHGVSLYLHGAPPTLLVAGSARMYGASWAGPRRLEFQEGVEYRGFPGGESLRVSRFRVYQASLPGSGAVVTAPPPALAALTPLQWQWRLAPVFSCLVLALLAVALTAPLPGGRWYLRALLGIALLLLYHNLLVAGRTLLEQQWLATLPGLWAVHALFAGGAALLLLRPFRAPHRMDDSGRRPTREA